MYSNGFLLASFSPGIPFLLTFPVLLCTTRLAPSTSHYILFCTTNLQSLLPSTTRLAQSTSQCYFVLQSLHKAFPIIYCFGLQTYRVYFPVLIPSTRLAQKALPSATFVLQSLHKALPIIYYFVLQTYRFPVLIRTATLAQSTSQYFFVLQSLHKALPSTNS